MTSEENFLEYSAQKLDQLCGRVVECIGRMTPEQVWIRGSEEQNAAGNLLLHLTGNVRQWILSGVGGHRNTRVRAAEFAARGGSAPEDLVAALRDTVDEANRVIRALPAERLTERVTIQGHEVSVLEAVYHVVEHFSGHTGQIIYMTKAFTGRGLGFYSYLEKPGAAATQVP